jgi:hypothetical protein
MDMIFWAISAHVTCVPDLDRSPIEIVKRIFRRTANGSVSTAAGGRLSRSYRPLEGQLLHSRFLAVRDARH